MKRKRGCAIAVFGLLGVLLLAIGGNLLLGVPLPTMAPPMGYYPYIHVPIPGGEAIEYGVWAGHSSWDRASRCGIRWHRSDGVRQYLVWVGDTLHVDIRATPDYRVIWLVRHGALGPEVVGSLDRGTGECLDVNAMPVNWRRSLAEQEGRRTFRFRRRGDEAALSGAEEGQKAVPPVEVGDWGFPKCATPAGGILLAKWPDTWPPRPHLTQPPSRPSLQRPVAQDDCPDLVSCVLYDCTVRDVSFSPGGNRVAVATEGYRLNPDDGDALGGVAVWEPAAARGSALVQGAPASQVRFAQGGRALLVVQASPNDASTRYRSLGHPQALLATYDATSGRRLRQVEPTLPAQSAGPLDAIVQVTPDGETAVIEGGRPLRAYVWSAGHPSSPAPLPEEFSHGLYAATATSPDGAYVARVHRDLAGAVGPAFGELGLYSMHTRKRLWAAQMPDCTKSGGDCFNDVAFSPDSRYVALARLGVTVRSSTTGEVVKRLADGLPIAKVAFSPDGRTLAAAIVRAGKDGKLQPATPEAWYSWTDEPSDGTDLALYDLRTGRACRWHAHTRGVTALRFSPDGRLLASGAGDGALKLWRLRAPWVPHGRDGDAILAPWPPRRFVARHSHPVRDIAFSRTGPTLAVAFGERPPRGEGCLELINTASGAHTTLDGRATYGLVACTPTDPSLAAVRPYWRSGSAPSEPPQPERSMDRLLFWDLHGPQGVDDIYLPTESETQCEIIALSPDAREVVYRDGTDGRTVVCAIKWRPPAPVVIAGEAAGRVAGRFEAQTPITLLPAATAPNTSVGAFSPDGRYYAQVRRAAADGGGSEVTQFETATWRRVAAFSSAGWQTTDEGVEATDEGTARALGFSADSRYLAVAADVVTIRETKTRKAVQRVPIGAQQLAFSPDGGYLALVEDEVRGDGRRFIRYDLKTGKQRSWEVEPAPVNCMEFAPDGKLLAAGNEQGTVWLWETDGW